MLNTPDRAYSAAPQFADADVTPVAALLAEPARAAMLWALSDGRALPAGELALVARVTAPSASAHLAKLVAGGLVAAERHGRHRYFRLADVRLTAALEALATVSPPARTRDLKQAHAAREIRLARTCYDHLAGWIGVQVTDALTKDHALALSGDEYSLTAMSHARFSAIGIDVVSIEAIAKRTRRPLARACLDWSERRYHVAGAIGAALVDRFLAAGWVERKRSTRALKVTDAGRRALRAHFDITLFK
jgi:DNA-binding transcriptional ArsR family regulator